MFRLLASTLAALSFGMATQAFAQSQPEIVKASFDKIYVPMGFDSNDNVQVVGEGTFMNTCYKPAPTKFTVDKEAKTVHLQPQAYFYNGMCLMVALPFNRTVDIGILPSGEWTVTQGDSNFIVGHISVASTFSKSADDFIYAPVSQAFFKQKDGKNQVVLSIELPCDGLPVENVRVHVQRDVLVLQPILADRTRSGCVPRFLPVEKIVDVGDVPAGRYLLHVRSMNGNAINTLVQAQ